MPVTLMRPDFGYLWQLRHDYQNTQVGMGWNVQAAYRASSVFSLPCRLTTKICRLFGRLGSHFLLSTIQELTIPPRCARVQSHLVTLQSIYLVLDRCQLPVTLVLCHFSAPPEWEEWIPSIVERSIIMNVLRDHRLLVFREDPPPSLHIMPALSTPMTKTSPPRLPRLTFICAHDLAHTAR
jgi:hypothetical protein